MSAPAFSRSTVTFGRALGVASLVNALLVVAKESSPAVMAFLQRLTGHHWISHCAITLSVFALIGLLSPAPGQAKAARFFPALFGGLILGALLIAAFYLFAD